MKKSKKDYLLLRLIAGIFLTAMGIYTMSFKEPSIGISLKNFQPTINFHSIIYLILGVGFLIGFFIKPHKSIKLLVIQILSLSLIGCSNSNNETYFLFPKNEIIRSSNIEEFGKTYPIKFYNYYGFTSTYNDSILDTFLIRFKSEKKLMFDVSKPNDIIKFLKDDITGFRFGKIPEDKISFDSLNEHLQALYPETRTIKVDNVYFLEHSRYGRVLSVEYVNIGIPGYFINLIPIHTSHIN